MGLCYFSLSAGFGDSFWSRHFESKTQNPNCRISIFSKRRELPLPSTIHLGVIDLRRPLGGEQDSPTSRTPYESSRIECQIKLITEPLRFAGESKSFDSKTSSVNNFAISVQNCWNFFFFFKNIFGNEKNYHKSIFSAVGVNKRCFN